MEAAKHIHNPRETCGFPSHAHSSGQPDVVIMEQIGYEEGTAWVKSCAPLHEDRVPRMLEMIDKVNAFGMAIDAEDVLSRAKGSVGRPHLAMAMMDAGYVASMDEAFEKWLGDGRPCNVERPKPSLAEATALVDAPDCHDMHLS